MEKSHLPHSSRKRELDPEYTDAERQDGDPSERSALQLQIHEPLYPSVVEPSPKRQKVDLQSNDEQHFYNLFQRILEDIRGPTDISDEDVNQAINDINKSFVFNSNNPPANYSQTKVVCGYLSRYATHTAGLVRTRILEAVCNCLELKSALKKEGELRVVSIGGGPGSDALGFCSALSELGLDGWTSLDITVVDAAEGWRECVTLLDQHLREGEFGSVSKMFKERKVTMSFVQANLPGDPEKDIRCYDALTKADIILECKMMFRLEFEPRERILKALCQTIKDDALALPIHTTHNDQFWRKEFRFLYEPKPEIRQVYRLSNFNERFGHCDSTESESQIRVLAKEENSHTQNQKRIIMKHKGYVLQDLHSKKYSCYVSNRKSLAVKVAKQFL